MSAAAVLAHQRAWWLTQADVLAGLAELPDESINCVVTSPPYWSLRSYLPTDHPDKALEMGSEPTPDAFVARLVAVFREVKRVLRRDGTCWVNLGDSYTHNGACGGGSPVGDRLFRETDRVKQQQMGYRVPAGLKPKDLIGMPWRVALALQSDGWWLRSAITLCKRAPMPESVTDRPTSATEMLFLLTKAPRYWYDQAAVAEPVTDADAISDLQYGRGQDVHDLWSGAATDRVLPSEERSEPGRDVSALRECPRCGLAQGTGSGVGAGDGPPLQRQRAGEAEARRVQPLGEAQANGARVRPLGEGTGSSRPLPGVREAEGSPAPLLRERQGQGDDQAIQRDAEGQGIEPEDDPQAPSADRHDQHADSAGVGGDQGGARVCVCLLRSDGSALDAGPRGPVVQGRPAREGQHRAGVPIVQQPTRQPTRNLRNYWELSPEPFPGAHFAVFPTEIPRRAILAGCPSRVCPRCGAPWTPTIERTRYGAWTDHNAELAEGNKQARGDGSGLNFNGVPTNAKKRAAMYQPPRTTGWSPGCTHDLPSVPGVVLDPFAGSGTSLVVALRLGRRALGIELSPAYCDLATRRIVGDAPLLNTPEVALAPPAAVQVPLWGTPEAAG